MKNLWPLTNSLRFLPLHISRLHFHYSRGTEGLSSVRNIYYYYILYFKLYAFATTLQKQNYHNNLREPIRFVVQCSKIIRKPYIVKFSLKVNLDFLFRIIEQHCFFQTYSFTTLVLSVRIPIISSVWWGMRVCFSHIIDYKRGRIDASCKKDQSSICYVTIS